MSERSGRDADQAARYAARLLTARPLSEKEFRTRLAGKGFGPPVVEAVAARFKELGYLNDASTARQWARSLAVNRLWGNYRIERTLKEKGLPGEIIDEALALARQELTERAAVLELLRKKQRDRKPGPEDFREKRRLMQSLMGKGFPPGLIFEILSINAEEQGYDGE